MATPDVTLLLDSDIIAYKFAAAAEERVDWDGDGEYSYTIEPLDDVTPKVAEYIQHLVTKLSATRVIVCLSCPTSENFRLRIFPAYKQNRAAVRKPELLAPLKQFMRDTYECYERPSLEADDIMGILSTHPKLIPGKKIIVSEDKDMQTVPGWLFNPAKDKEPRYITMIQADRFHLYQTLVGDACDNYKGASQIGPVKADKILDDDPTWYAVLWTFICRGHTKEEALVQARVARICRSSDYNFNDKEVVLWQPT